jgi:hypothetical protein
MRWLFAFVLLALLLVACGAPDSGSAPATAVQPAAPTAAANAADPCGAAALQSYRSDYSDIYSRWSMAMITAGRAQPADLQVPIEQLQSISTELMALEPPECAVQANNETAQAMQQIITGYQSLQGGKTVGQVLTAAIDMLALARDRVNALPGELAPTHTPAPTPSMLPTLTPVPTSTPTSTPLPSPTPEPRNGIIDSKNAPIFDSPTATTPVKTLARGTAVLVFELQKGRLHIKAGDVDGWVSQSAVIIQ